MVGATETFVVTQASDKKSIHFKTILSKNFQNCTRNDKAFKLIQPIEKYKTNVIFQMAVKELKNVQL